MIEVVFAKAFRRHVDCPDAPVRLGASGTLRDALDAYFDSHPAVRSYVLDDVGGLRRHVAVFVDGDLVADRVALSDPLTSDSTIHVFQALSGG